MKKISSFLLGIFLFFNISNLISQVPSENTIKWITYKEAFDNNTKGNKRKILVDTYTHWCYWCKEMDKKTFSHPEIINIINSKYWAVKLDAEYKDTLIINNITYINPNPEYSRSLHQLATELLQNQASFPSFVFLDENNQKITIAPGFFKPTDFEIILNYIAENGYLNQPYEKYRATFKSTIK